MYIFNINPVKLSLYLCLVTFFASANYKVTETDTLVHIKSFESQITTPYQLRINSGGGELNFEGEVFQEDAYYVGNSRASVNTISNI